MKLINLLIENKATILEKWIDQALGNYPADASRIFKKQKNRFANPIGFRVSHTLTEIYDALAGQDDLTSLPPVLEELVKILAIQASSPSQAVSFIYALKYVVKEQCQKAGLDTLTLGEWLDFDKKIDTLAYTVFDLYMASRERLYQVRVNELKSGNHIMTDGSCPSAAMRRNKKRQTELKPITNHSST